jgi:hypothetical protein
MLEHWLKLFRDWLRRHDHPAAYLWVREGVSGDHAHILLHLPPGLRLSLSLQWTARASGAPYVVGAAKTLPIRGADDPAGTRYAQNLERVVNYVMKGAVPAVAAQLDIRRRAQGRLYGKRCGVSRSLDRRARRGGNAPSGCRESSAARDRPGGAKSLEVEVLPDRRRGQEFARAN